jgi:hypothetical protein
MQRVLTRIDDRTKEFAAHPFFAYLKDTSVDPIRRISFAPALAHFVMTFADLYRYVLHQDAQGDPVQELVNAHAAEDGGHWKWFIADLKALGEDRRLDFSRALQFLWGDETIRLRMLSYRICRLGLGASALHKVALVQCIEATGRVTLGHVGPLGVEVGRRTGKKLVYFGSTHLETEGAHTLETDDARALLGGIRLSPAHVDEISHLVDAVFADFMSTADEILRFSMSGKGLAG